MKYTYVCLSCKKDFEHDISISEYELQAVVKCPKCWSFSVKRTYTPINVIYRGDGFTKSVSEES